MSAVVAVQLVAVGALARRAATRLTRSGTRPGCAADLAHPDGAAARARPPWRWPPSPRASSPATPAAPTLLAGDGPARRRRWPTPRWPPGSPWRSRRSLVAARPRRGVDGPGRVALPPVPGRAAGAGAGRRLDGAASRRPRDASSGIDVGSKGRRYLAHALTAEQISRGDRKACAATDPDVRRAAGRRAIRRPGRAWPCASSTGPAASTAPRCWCCMPTGSGWVDPAGVGAAEYLYGGDVASVAVQYDDVPSWVAYLKGSGAGRETATAVLDAVRARVDAMPAARRPQVLLFGESLGALAGLHAPVDRGRTPALWVGVPGPARERAHAGVREPEPAGAAARRRPGGGLVTGAGVARHGAVEPAVGAGAQLLAGGRATWSRPTGRRTATATGTPPRWSTRGCARRTRRAAGSPPATRLAAGAGRRSASSPRSADRPGWPA